MQIEVSLLSQEGPRLFSIKKEKLKYQKKELFRIHAGKHSEIVTRPGLIRANFDLVGCTADDLRQFADFFDKGEISPKFQGILSVDPKIIDEKEFCQIQKFTQHTSSGRVSLQKMSFFIIERKKSIPGCYIFTNTTWFFINRQKQANLFAL